MKNMKVRRLKKKTSAYQHAANIRKYVNQIKQDYQTRLPEGELVSEKYYTGSVGLLIGKVKAQRRNTRRRNMTDFSALYAARSLYIYTVQVLWMNHKDVELGELNKIGEHECQYIKLCTQKKKV